MRNSTTRRLFSLAIWLAIGLVLTVGVAWGMSWALFSGHWLSATHEELQPANWPFDPPPDWPFPTVSERFDMTGRTVWTASIREPIAGLRQGRYRSVTRWHFGWPCRSLEGGCTFDGGDGTTIPPPKPVFRWCIEGPVLKKKYYEQQVGFPYRPLPLGLLVNTLFYAVFAWGLWQIPILLRRHSRRRAGRCVGCGYDRHGIATGVVCPECGRA